MNSVQYSLPYPPSTNMLFRGGDKGHARFRTKVYNEWSTAATAAVWEQERKRLKGPVKLTLRVRRPDKRRRDISNLIKAVEDLMVEMGVIEDDSLVEWIDAQWVYEGDPCVVHIRTMALLTGETT